MKSQLLKQALMANYVKGGKVGDPPVKKKKVEAKNPMPIMVKSIDEIPKDAVIEKDPVTGEEYWVKRPKGGTPKIEPKKEPGTPPKPYTPTTGTKKSYGSGKPKDGTKPKELPGNPPTEFETEQRWVIKPKTTELTTPKIAFGWNGELRETFAEQGNAPVMVNGKPTRLQTFLIPAQYDQKTGAWNSNTGNMDPTKVRGYVGADGNFVAVKQEMSPNPSLMKYQGKESNFYTPESLVPWGNGDGAKLRKEGAMRATGATSDQAKITESLPNGTKISETVAPVNTQGGGYGIGKDVSLEIMKDKIAPAPGLNMSTDTPPIVNPNAGKNLPSSGDNINLLYKRKKEFKSGGLVSKYVGGGPVVNPNVTYNDSGIYNQQSNKGLSKLMQQQSQQPNGGGLKLDDGMDVANAGLDVASKSSKFSKLSGQEKQGLGTALDAVGQLAGTGVDALDKKDGYSTIAGQAGAGALRGAGKGAAIGLNPAVMALTGGNSAWIAPIAGAVIGGTVGAVKGKKEKTERIGLAADEMRGSVADQQYSDSKDTFKSESFREQDTKKGLRGLFAKGGTIKGPGTGTSDSIETKAGKDGIPYGSFIAPAVNNKENGLARWIREEVLGDNPNKVAGFKKGGNADMAVSNGEHLFTPAEKKKITAYLGQEILEELAPEAEENEESEDKKYGGMVGMYAKGGCVSCGKMKCECDDMKMAKGGNLSKSKAATMLHDGTIRGKKITDQQRKYFAVVASGKAKYADGGNVKGNTTKRMTSSGNAALDAEIDLLYKTGNWRADAVDKIEAKAKALGLDVGDNPLSPSLRTGVFKDLKYKKDYFKTEVNKELQGKKQQREYEAKRLMFIPSAPKGLSENDMQTYNKLKKEAVVDGKGLTPIQNFVAEKKDSLEESNKFQSQLKRGIETGKDYAKKYQLAQDLKANLEYAKKNADKFTAKELQSLAEQEKAASLAYSKLKTPSQYATPNNKRLDVIYEGFAKKQYKPTQVEQRSAAPVLQEKIEVKPVVQAVKPAAPAVTSVAAQDTQKVVTAPVKPVVVPPVTKVAPTKKKEVAVTYVDEDF